MNISVINGPNINMLGVREPDIYGKETYGDLVEKIENHCKAKGITVEVFQSNHEGMMIDKIQDCLGKKQGIIINAGGYTHTSIAIMDALKGVDIPTIEVHISDIINREKFRQMSYISMVAKAVIVGKGTQGYIEAIDLLQAMAEENRYQ